MNLDEFLYEVDFYSHGVELNETTQRGGESGRVARMVLLRSGPFRFGLLFKYNGSICMLGQNFFLKY